MALTTVAYHWQQACSLDDASEVPCALKAVEYWQKAAEEAYEASALTEAHMWVQPGARAVSGFGPGGRLSFMWFCGITVRHRV